MKKGWGISSVFLVKTRRIYAQANNVKVSNACCSLKRTIIMKWLWITLVALICDTQSIQNRIIRPVRFVEEDAVPTRHFRHIDASYSASFDWEQGLREATAQALLREHIGDQDLRKRIYAAPLLGGKQNKATPFGDIAVLARGQIYANYAGFIFVQDPYQNDCDNCHTIEIEALKRRCVHNHCQIWHPRNNEHLLALWSIKRIRHRSLQSGQNRMEVEFTISPIGLRPPREPYLTKEGTFNYNKPGHVFILRSPEIHHKNLDNFQKVNQFKHGAFIAQAQDGTKYILHSFPEILTPQITRYQSLKDSAPTSTITTKQYSEEDAKKVYQTLLEVLHKKTSLEPHRFTHPTTKTSTTIPGNTLVQFSGGQVIPITEIETPFITKTTPGYVTMKFPKEPITTSSRPLFTPSTTHIIPPSVAPTSHIEPQKITTTKQSTTHQTTVPQTPNNRYTPLSRPQYITTQGVITETTTAPVKMTFHFFAAEEDKPTTPDFSKKPLTIIPQRDYSKIENALPSTTLSTEGPTVFTSQSITTQNIKQTTRTPFTTISSSRPSTIIKVTKPIPQTSSFTNEISTRSYESSTTIFESTITKKPYSAFTVPITVLEDTSTGTTSQQKYPTTIFEDSVPIIPTPFNTIKEPTIKYTNTEFYNSTTRPTTPEVDITTVLQGTTDIFETTEPITETTYKVPEGGSVETTVGMTMTMGNVQNQTTQMVYFTSEETEQPITSDLANLPTTASTKPTNTLIQETKSTSTPKRIVTTIAADGTVSVKTTPFYPAEDLFGLTKSFTKEYKTTKSYKVSSTEPSDFLIESEPQQDNTRPLFKKPLKDYSDDDIFGQTKSDFSKTLRKPNVTKKYTKSDVEQALFDSHGKKSKALLERKSTTAATPSKVLYSDFFEASTLVMMRPPLITVKNLNFSTVAPIFHESTTELPIRPTLSPYKVGDNDTTIPVTSQSYLTSISYKINKKKKPVTGTEINSTSTNIDIMKEGIYVDELNSFNNDFALRLLGQAKGVAYLDKATTSASTLASTSAKTTKKPRYTRRRSYVARSKRPKRKKNTQNGNSKLYN